MNFILSFFGVIGLAMFAVLAAALVFAIVMALFEKTMTFLKKVYYIRKAGHKVVYVSKDMMRSTKLLEQFRMRDKLHKLYEQKKVTMYVVDYNYGFLSPYWLASHRNCILYFFDEAEYTKFLMEYGV